MPDRKTFLITAGPTIEDIDPVRFISNRSTGKMGIAIAAAALKNGHAVILVHGPVSDAVLEKLPRTPALTRVPVRSAAGMHKAVMKHARRANVVIMNAAVADYTPAASSPVKLKKSAHSLTLKLHPTVDILKELGAKKPKLGFFLIGFALETGSGHSPAQRRTSQLKEARRKLRDKNLDAIVLDSPHAMGADRSDFTILTRLDTPEKFLRNITKPALAAELIRCVSRNP